MLLQLCQLGVVLFASQSRGASHEGLQTLTVFGLRARLRAFAGWPEIASEVRARLVTAPGGARPLVVADSFIQAAQIDFELGGAAEVFTEPE